MHKVRDALRLSAQILGVAKVGLIPSGRLAKSAYEEISQIKSPNGALSFPAAAQRLREIEQRIMPSQQACRQACDEVMMVLRQLNAQIRTEKMGAAPLQMRPNMS